MAGRLLVIGDVHGEYDMLCKVIDKSKYDPEKDTLILVGDYIDRGPQSKKTINKIKELTDSGAIALKGNHEKMAYDYACKVKTGTQNNNDIYFFNGGQKTLNKYSNLDNFIKDVEWLNNLPLYEKIDDQYIFVHAGLKPGVKLEEQTQQTMLWIRDEHIYHDWSQDKNIKETIVSGHTPFEQVYFSSQKIFVDTGAGKGGYLSLVDLTNDKIYRSGR